jgi:HK97 gp10 family phage protein
VSDTKVTLTGIEDMKRQLAALGYALENKIAHGAMLDGANILKAEVKRRAPVGPSGSGHEPGTLRDNVIVKRDPQVPGQASYAVLVRKTKVTKKVRRIINRLHAGGFDVVFSNDPYYWRFEEFGHKIVRGKKVVGDYPARPFFRPAIDAVKDQLIGAVGDGLQKRIDAFIAKGS